jgi:hypothetical protein
MAVSLPVAATMYASCASDTLRPLAWFGNFGRDQVFYQRSANPHLVEINHETILDLQHNGISGLLDSISDGRYAHDACQVHTQQLSNHTPELSTLARSPRLAAAR